MKVSDIIARFLEEKEIKYAFGIIGAGNAHIFDSIYQRGYTEIICVHHEQAACMAMQTYYRITGKVTAAILTTGGGATNGLTGVVSAWADSIPGLIISGNENSRFINLHKNLRMWGIQGYDSSEVVKTVTKYAGRVLEPENIIYELDLAYSICTQGRPGPCWIDIPMNIQSNMIEESTLKQYHPKRDETLYQVDPAKIESVIQEFKTAKRPVILLGNGIRLSHAEHLIKSLIDALKAPILVSWAGIDMVDSYHPLVYGRAGTYGQRCANLVVQNCDFLLAIGTRMAIPQVGYDISEYARAAKIAVVDIDAFELEKYPERTNIAIAADAKAFIEALLAKLTPNSQDLYKDWITVCDEYREKYPWVSEWEHPDQEGFINSYRFMERFNEFLKPDQIITTDMGTALLCGHQVLKLKDGQRLMTSTGLGEMGYGLPAAIGASFARDKGEVLCLNCDGGMMMNLQELQTVVHHNLPIKIIIFNNDGYLMIKHTQNALFKGRNTGTDKKSGVSCPDYSALGKAFGIPTFQIKTWEDFNTIVPLVQDAKGPVICEVFMHPHQVFVPKLSLAIQKDGSLISPPLEDLFPFVSREDLKKDMLIGIHEKSKNIEQ